MFGLRLWMEGLSPFSRDRGTLSLVKAFVRQPNRGSLHAFSGQGAQGVLACSLVRFSIL